MTAIEDILGADGLLSRRIPGFAVRQAQIEMAQAVADAMDAGRVLICEAGTGTGKTYAYLVPALLAGKKVIVSTGTRNLQDQLYHRDLPVIRETLASPARTALLKGRANYLCLHRLASTPATARFPIQHLGKIHRVRLWVGRTRSGDVAELGLPEDDGVLPWVTSTTDNCLGQECPDWDRCFLVEARRRAQEADLVVINHHLLCADIALKGEGFGEILPGADCFVIDEAHQLPEVASGFFGTTLSARQVLELARDLEVEYHQEAGDVPEVPRQADRLVKAVRDLRLSFGAEPRRGTWRDIDAVAETVAALAQLDEALDGLRGLLEGLEGRGKGLDSCLARCIDLRGRLQGLIGGDSDTDIRWYETQQQGFRLNRTPLEISDLFGTHLKSRPAAWVFTSATLAVKRGFEHFSRQLGIVEAETGLWDSPFDYPNQALLCLPRGLPEPQAPGFNRAVAAMAVSVLEASRGRAFLLYTSHRALQEAAEYLRDRIAFPLLVQGSAPRAELLERFREAGNAVLLGTSSFWEGVDVRGEALSCVIIDKLPFASPGDPVLQARIDTLRRGGGNPFRDLQLPQAVIALKQGAGRLIRDETDRGVLLICDTRLVSRSYGRTFVDSLPPMRRTRDLAEVIGFFASESGGA